MENGDMNEKICLAPGPSSGIGKATAHWFEPRDGATRKPCGSL